MQRTSSWLGLESDGKRRVLNHSPRFLYEYWALLVFVFLLARQCCFCILIYHCCFYCVIACWLLVYCMPKSMLSWPRSLPWLVALFCALAKAAQWVNCLHILGTCLKLHFKWSSFENNCSLTLLSWLLAKLLVCFCFCLCFCCTPCWQLPSGNENQMGGPKSNVKRALLTHDTRYMEVACTYMYVFSVASSL